MPTGAALGTLKGHSSSANAVVFSLDGDLVASASNDRTGSLWDAATGVALQKIEGHSSGVSTMAFLPNGKLASRGRAARL